MTGRAARFFGILFMGVLSYQLVTELPRYIREENWVAVTLNSLSYLLIGGMGVLFVIRIVKQFVWCGKGHTWVYHPPQYSKKNPTKLKWHAYTDCTHCFQHKESFEKEEAQRKHECPSCGTHIPW